MNDTTATLGAALVYAEHDVPVFPVYGVEGQRCACGADCGDNAGKHPLTAHGFKDASRDPATIDAWWQQWPTANLATPTGGWCAVLDIDPRHGGDETLAALERQHGELPTTAEVLTGGGGRHIYFQPVAGLRSRNDVAPGLDIKAEAGYVLLPPSRHVSGREYADEVLAPLFETPLAPMPAWLLALARGTHHEPGGRIPVEAPAFTLPETVREGARNATLYRLARSLKARGLTAAEVADSLYSVNEHRCTPPLEVAELLKIGEHAWTAPDRPEFAASRNGSESYIESVAAFLAEPDPPVRVIFPELLPTSVIMLLHGEPRARKSLVAFELALAAATGTAPFGLARFNVTGPVDVLYIQEEDPRPLTRVRLRALIATRGAPPATLHVAVRRGVNLDDPAWVARLVADVRRLNVKLLVLDAARRLSAKTDEGPAKVRELVAALRAIVTATGVCIVIVHHDVKPPQNGQDQRRRSQRASGGDWFAACECPVHVERVSSHESLVFPEDYKFTSDPAPFTFTCETDGALITRLVGLDTTTEAAERAGVRGRVLDWLRVNGPATKTDMKKAGLGQWPAIEAALDLLMKENKADAAPGRQRGSLRYFVIKHESSEAPIDDSRGGATDGR